MEIAQVNLPVGLLIWVMIIPMLLKIDFGALGRCGSTCAASASRWPSTGWSSRSRWRYWRGSSSATSSTPYLPAGQIDSYVAGLICSPRRACTAMVFVWSRLTGGDPYFTLSQVALNDTIMIFAFAPIVALLLGLSSITVPWDTLLISVGMYIVIPVVIAQIVRAQVLARGGQPALERLLARIGPCRSRRCSPRWCCCSPSRASRS